MLKKKMYQKLLSFWKNKINGSIMMDKMPIEVSILKELMPSKIKLEASPKDMRTSKLQLINFNDWMDVSKLTQNSSTLWYISYYLG